MPQFEWVGRVFLRLLSWRKVIRLAHIECGYRRKADAINQPVPLNYVVWVGFGDGVVVKIRGLH